MAIGIIEKTNMLVKFGKRVRELRKKLGLSQEKFADKVGCHRTYIGMIERAEKNLTITNIYKIAKVLNITMAELMRGIY